MKLFLASSSGKEYLKDELRNCLYTLESFYYIKDWQIEMIPRWRDFLLDSGAFTFMASKKGNNIQWDAYIDRYIEFINANQIKLYFELDIDYAVGYDKVKAIRRQLETRTGRQSIPVWHRSRGLEEYKNLCREYSYIAIGGIAIKDIKSSEYRYFYKLLNIAAQQGTKVHGLGFTPPSIQDYPFYSVDSSSWTTGSRYATIYQFSNGKILSTRKPEKRLVNYAALDRHNLKQWLKFQHYLDFTGA